MYKPYRNHRIPRRFCSQVCSNLGREITIGEIAKRRGQPPVTLICAQCHTPFTLLACFAKNRRFCSRKCWGDNRIGKPSQHVPGKQGSFGKGGFREDIGLYVRSRWEANYIRYLIHTGHEFKYEPKQFLITLPDGTQHSYTPDLLVDDHHYVEIKGWMRADRRQAEVIKHAQSQINKPLTLLTQSGYKKLEQQFSNKIPDWERRGDSFPRTERVCPVCGKIVKSIHHKTIYCSRKCSALAKTPEQLSGFISGGKSHQFKPAKAPK